MLMIIVGAVAGGLLILMLIIVITMTCHHKRRNQKLEKELTEKRYVCRAQCSIKGAISYAFSEHYFSSPAPVDQSRTFYYLKNVFDILLSPLFAVSCK